MFAKRILMTVVTVLAVSACTLDKQDAPDVVGPSGLGLSLDIKASPDALLRDGLAQSTIEITAKDALGNAVPDLGLQVVASLNLGTIQTGSLKTNSSGRASTVYVAPSFGPATTVTVTVTPSGSNYQNTVPDRKSVV